MDAWKPTPNERSTELADPDLRGASALDAPSSAAAGRPGDPVARVTRTLLVEDDVALLGAMQESLEARGFEVTCVTDGTSALEALRTLDFDVVLMDLGLPAMGGSTLLHEIRRDPLVDGIPIVVLSGSGDRAMERVASARVYAVHRKPANASSIARSLRHAAYYG